MKPKWIPITEDYELTNMAMVTRIINKNKLDTTIGFPGWGLQNKTVAYMDLPNVYDSGWKSEYRGDELPEKNNSCIVLLFGAKDYNYNKYRVAESYFLAKRHEWLRIPNDWEVAGWMDYPKPPGKPTLVTQDDKRTELDSAEEDFF